MPGSLAGLAIGAGIKGLAGLFGGGARAKEAKRNARNEQRAMQYKVNKQQKGLNRRSLNFASLLKALGREGWFGEQFMKDKGSYNAADFTYDPVPLMESPGVWSSALGGAAQGAVGGLADWYGDAGAAGREAAGRVTSPGQPITMGRTGPGTYGYRPGSTSAALGDFELE